MESKEIARKWRTKRVFNAESDRFKKKEFILNSPIEMNMYGLSIESLYPLVSADILNRYYKMAGKNLMYSLVFNDSTLYSYTFCHDHHILPSDLYNNYIDSLANLGIGYDSNKTFHFTMERVIKYYQDKFYSLFNDKITLKKGPVYMDSIGLHIYNFYEIYEENSKYYVIDTKEEVFLQEGSYLSLNIEPYFDEIKRIIKGVNISLSLKDKLYQMLGEYNYIEMDLSNYKDNLTLKVSLNEPELIAGVSFIALNPSLIDITPYISKEEENTVKRYLENGYQEGVFTGNTVKNPLTGEDIYIFISYDFDEDIHVAIPSLNEKDFNYTLSFGLDINDILDGDILKNSDFLNDLTRSEARLRIMNSFVSEEMGKIKTSFKVKELILSSNEEYGIIVPIKEKEKLDGYEIINNEFYPIYYNSRGKISFTHEDKYNYNGNLINHTFNNTYLYGLLHDLTLNEENNSMSLKNIDFKGENTFFVHKDRLFQEFLVPEIFNLVLDNKNTNSKYIFLDNKELNYNEISEANSLHVNYLEDMLNNVSPDSLRMYILTNTHETDFNKIELHISKYEQFLNIVKEKLNEEFEISNYSLDQELYSLTQNVNMYIRENNMTSYLEEVMRFYYEHLANEKITENQALIYTKILSLVAPFITQELFEDVFKQSYFLVYEEWPYLN